LLSFQSIGSRVFGEQTAFNLLPRFGVESKEDLQREGLEIRAEVAAAVGDVNEDSKISLNLVHAPVFYGLTFIACADLGEGVDAAKLIAACREAGRARRWAGRNDEPGNEVNCLCEPRAICRGRGLVVLGAAIICCRRRAESSWRIAEG
jgi:aspartate-semialdehyde dehydrogenase